MTTVNPHGLHHVTAIASSPQRNVDFYTRTLGLRLVKQTVNFDAPDSYHLYYGDEQGSPSSLLTFFPWPDVPKGRQGAGMTTATAFSVPGSSLGWWHERFKTLRVDTEAPIARDDEEVLTFRDPDGMVIDLVAAEERKGKRFRTKRNDGERSERQCQRQKRREQVNEFIHAARHDIFFKQEFQPIRSWLQQAMWADPMRTDTRLHERDTGGAGPEHHDQQQRRDDCEGNER